MKRVNIVKLVIIATAVGVVGCSPFNKLLKLNDSEQMYRAAINYYHDGDFQHALQLFEELAPRYASTMRSDTIMYYTGCCFYKQGDFHTSGRIFDEYRSTYGRSPLLEDVEYMHAMGYYFSSPQPSRDQTTTLQAIRAIGEYMERYPSSPKMGICEMRLEELKNKLYDKSFINARTYYKTGRYKAAIIAFENALAEFPDTPHREEILFLTLDASYRLADNSLASLQVDRFLDTMDAYYNFISEFPESKHAKAAERMQRAAKRFLAKHNADADATEAEDAENNNQTIQ
ncbi:MAG: outer membrane protein assembly factor BamD [Tidjanibacter sp.]|nr:outer membrane protein assembly factor BamD [Tidjanibacter sp.]